MTSQLRPLLEVCVTSVDDALAAAAGGADRLELCVALELGGLTPSAGLLAEVRAAVELPIVALVRPRAGDFCFSANYKRTMIRDAAWLLEHGADALACGALTVNRAVDLEYWRAIVQLAGGQRSVFHRAFDEVDDQCAALEQLIELGAVRILTSGGAATALAGAMQLARLVERAAGRCEILPAGGISADVIAPLLETTGCQQIHGSFREMAAAPPRSSAARVAAARAALDACQAS
jgi:copper homeostasis protein